MLETKYSPALPDLASNNSDGVVAINWVGMENIAAICTVDGIRLAAKADAKVCLDHPSARGIHMSRLYTVLESALETQALTPLLLRQITQDFLHSHQELSHAALVQIRFELPLKRKALQSGLTGWRHYPVTLKAVQTGMQVKIELGVEVLYSSTCPCSAALARELVADAFAEQFADQAMISVAQVGAWLRRADGASYATPHAQRSVLQVSLLLTETAEQFALASLIDGLEACLQTPVQTAVKRVDEQEFARRNGANLMFVEDAIRKVHQYLQSWPQQRGFIAKVAHLESLHAHDAVAEIAAP